MTETNKINKVQTVSTKSPTIKVPTNQQQSVENNYYTKSKYVYKFECKQCERCSKCDLYH